MVVNQTVPYAGPALGGPLPLELANTTYAVRGRLQDGMASTGDLVAWLTQVRPRLDTQLTDADLLEVDDVHLERARELRDCIQSLAEASLDRKFPKAKAVDRLNHHVRIAHQWTELAWAEQPYAETRSSAPPVSTALCELARAAVGLFSSPQRTRIHRCGAPGCILYFLKDHPRREWCSVSCGNRVRAARHYELRKRTKT
jgi:predicted RNA-binding Zn ribbon-like protein